MGDLKTLILEALETYKEPTMILKENVQVSPELNYHIENKLSLTNNIFRYFSKKYFDLINEVRELYNLDLIELNEEDTMMVLSDTGEVYYDGEEEIYLFIVPLFCLTKLGLIW